MIKLYAMWYGFAVVATVVVWRLTSGVQQFWKKALFRTGIIAFGFTTIPLMRVGFYPIGLYFFADSSWLAAASTASAVIGFVWIILFASSYVVAHIFKKAQDRQWLYRQIRNSLVVGGVCTTIGIILLQRSLATQCH